MSESSSPLPAHLSPMAAWSADRFPADEERWAYEVKWDGVRALAFVSDGQVRLQNRNGVDVTGRYPGAAAPHGALGRRQVLLDGEVVAFDEEGRPDFNLLARHLTPISYVVFDVLHLDGRPLLQLPYVERRALLDGLGLGDIDSPSPSWQVPAYHVGDGAELFEATRVRGLEGLLAKRLDSLYVPGKRSRSWLKLKHRHRQELVVGGWIPGDGRRAGTLGALLVGYHQGTELRYAGRVGTGFTDGDLAQLSSLLRTSTRETQPFGPSAAWMAPRPVARSAQWVEPRLVVEVSFAEWTPDARLRHPAFLGIREDVQAASVIREPKAVAN